MKKGTSMKKWLSLLVVIIISLSSTAVWAKPIPTVFVNNVQVQLDQPPIIRNGTTLLPIRPIFNALGLEVGFDDEFGIAYSDLGNTRFSINYKYHPLALPTHIVINTDISALMDSEGPPPSPDSEYHYYKFTYPPVIVNGRALVPVKFLAKTLDLDISWDSKTNSININGELPESFKVIPGGMQSRV